MRYIIFTILGAILMFSLIAPGIRDYKYHNSSAQKKKGKVIPITVYPSTILKLSTGTLVGGIIGVILWTRGFNWDYEFLGFFVFFSAISFAAQILSYAKEKGLPDKDFKFKYIKLKFKFKKRNNNYSTLIKKNSFIKSILFILFIVISFFIAGRNIESPRNHWLSIYGYFALVYFAFMVIIAIITEHKRFSWRLGLFFILALLAIFYAILKNY